ncbi:MAG TPA: large conductance mechanosensitive channel protein MscL [Candidatus Limnocylindrales bacterium]|nr:large conductance mechanosensitive channel protein MscL [Candidatus Limnocylindrales bacterium]
MIKGFRDFIMRGNVVDLAVAVVIAGAFGAVVASLVADVLTPLLGFVGVPDFSQWTVTAGSAEIRIGAFLNTIITFFLIALAIYLLIVKPKEAFDARLVRDQEATTKGCPFCASDIPIAANRCPLCTSQLP